MKKVASLLLVCLIALGMTTCKNTQTSTETEPEKSSFVSKSTDENSTEATENTQQTENPTEGNQEMKFKNAKLYIKIGDKTPAATFADNSSAEALFEKLQNGDISIDMSDYSNFEKVGSLGFSLPRNDEQISTDYGDIILYQGNQLTIYYDQNSWRFTRIGKIDNITQDKLKSILGDGDVTVTLSINKN